MLLVGYETLTLEHSVRINSDPVVLSVPTAGCCLHRRSLRGCLRGSLRKSHRGSLQKPLRKLLRTSHRRSHRGSLRVSLRRSLRGSLRKNIRRYLRRPLRSDAINYQYGTVKPLDDSKALPKSRRAALANTTYNTCSIYHYSSGHRKVHVVRSTARGFHPILAAYLALPVPSSSLKREDLRRLGNRSLTNLTPL